MLCRVTIALGRRVASFDDHLAVGIGDQGAIRSASAVPRLIGQHEGSPKQREVGHIIRLAHREPVWHRRGAIRPLRQEPQRRAEPDASAAPGWSTMLSVAASVMRFFKPRQPRATVRAGTARGYRRVPATTATLGTRRNSNWNSIFGRAAADQLPRQEFAKNMPRIRRAARFTFASSTPQRSTGTAGPMENTT